MPGWRASDLMDEFVTTLSPEMDIYSAIECLLKKRLSGAPVLDGQSRLVGILSEKDCLRIVAAEAFEGHPHGRVADFMTTDVVTVSPWSTFYDLVDRFLRGRFRRLPVVDDQDKLVGVVSRTAVVKCISSMRDNPTLYGTPERFPPSDDSRGVDSAMRRARGR